MRVLLNRRVWQYLPEGSPERKGICAQRMKALAGGCPAQAAPSAPAAERQRAEQSAPGCQIALYGRLLIIAINSDLPRLPLGYPSAVHSVRIKREGNLPGLIYGNEPAIAAHRGLFVVDDKIGSLLQG